MSNAVAHVASTELSIGHAAHEGHTLMSSVPFTGRATSFSLPTRKSQVLSIPFFRVMGFDPDVTACGNQVGVI